MEQPVSETSPAPSPPQPDTTVQAPPASQPQSMVGRKACPECLTITGPRRMVCVCGHRFQSRKDREMVGKGKKSCPSCREVMSSRLATCLSCNHQFYERAPLKVKPSGPGKGMKACPECDAHCGSRSLSCECGHMFVIAKKRKRAQKQQDAPAPTTTPKQLPVPNPAPQNIAATSHGTFPPRSVPLPDPLSQYLVFEEEDEEQRGKVPRLTSHGTDGTDTAGDVTPQQYSLLPSDFHMGSFASPPPPPPPASRDFAPQYSFYPFQ